MKKSETELRLRANEFGQGHVFRFWKELQPEEKNSLLDQLNTIDFPLIKKLCEEQLFRKRAQKRGGELTPAPIIHIPRSEEEKRQEKLARDRGETLLSEGKVAAFLVAGGQGTRLGFDGPKGTYPIGPVSKRSLFQIHLEKIRALSRRYGQIIPLYVMVGSNEGATRAFFEKNHYFDFGEENIQFFQQDMLPAVNENGKFFMEEKHRLFTNPNGHGGSIKALYDSGCLDEMKQRGKELLYYFQVDNPLLKICDPVFLGYHATQKADISSKVVRKKDWTEKVGVLGLLDGKTKIIEYSDLSKTDARTTLDDGSLKYWAGSIAVHVLSMDFLERLNRGGFQLPYYHAEKSIPYIATEGPEAGKRINPDWKNGIKFETFVFDALAMAECAVTIEVERADEFGPLKNKTGWDSPHHCRALMTFLYLRWLKKCQATIKTKKNGGFSGFIEISPLTALDAEELSKKVSPSTLIQDGFLI